MIKSYVEFKVKAGFRGVILSLGPTKSEMISTGIFFDLNILHPLSLNILDLLESQK